MLPTFRQCQARANRQRPQAGPTDLPDTPRFAKKRDWQRKIQKMLKNDFKLEVESLISKDISYVTGAVRPGQARRQGLAGLSEGVREFKGCQ